MNNRNCDSSWINIQIWKGELGLGEWRDSLEQIMQKLLLQGLSISRGRSRASSNSAYSFRYPSEISILISAYSWEIGLILRCVFVRYKPVEALKTALEGSPPKTKDERCKVQYFLTSSSLSRIRILIEFVYHYLFWFIILRGVFVVCELDCSAQGNYGYKGFGQLVLFSRSWVLWYSNEVSSSFPFFFFVCIVFYPLNGASTTFLLY